MAAPFIVPFNFQPPAAPVLKTTSYTIPSGKYAKIEDLYGDTTFNTVTNAYDVYLVNQAAGVTNGLFYNYIHQSVVGASYYTISLTFSVSSSANSVNFYGANYGYSGTTWTGNPTGSAQLLRSGVGTGTTNHSKKAVNGYFNIYLFAGTGMTFTQLVRQWIGPKESMWVPSGTVITGTSYYVSEYNMIS